MVYDHAVGDVLGTKETEVFYCSVMVFVVEPQLKICAINAQVTLCGFLVTISKYCQNIASKIV